MGKHYGQGRVLYSVNEETALQLDQIRDIAAAMTAAGVSFWLFGGWGLDARIGRITRDHGDIEIWVADGDADRTRDAIVGAGFTYAPNDYPEESYEYLREGIKSSSAFFLRNEDGSFSSRGRFSDWRFPPSSFTSPPGRLGDVAVPTMSVEGMIAMKEQYATLRNGKPLRDKDIRDLVLLRSLLLPGPTISPA